MLHGAARQAWLGSVWSGDFRLGRQARCVQEWSGADSRGMEGHGSSGVVAVQGKAGEDWRGKDRHGGEWSRQERQARLGLSRPGLVRLVMAGETWLGEFRTGAVG